MGRSTEHKTNTYVSTRLRPYVGTFVPTNVTLHAADALHGHVLPVVPPDAGTHCTSRGEFAALYRDAKSPIKKKRLAKGTMGFSVYHLATNLLQQLVPVLLLLLYVPNSLVPKLSGIFFAAAAATADVPYPLSDRLLSLILLRTTGDKN